MSKWYQRIMGEWWTAKKLSTVLPFLSTGTNILDVGCGNGFVLKYLTEAGFLAKGVDVADHTVAEGVETLVYDGRTLPFKDNEFDTALLLTVLHHTSDPEIVLKETARVAKSVVIIEDVYSNIVQQYMTYAMDTLVNFGHSTMTYQNKSDKEWIALFERLGYTVKGIESRSVLLFFRQQTYWLNCE